MKNFKTSIYTAACALIFLGSSASATTVTWDSAFASSTANSEGSALSLTVDNGASAGTWDIKLVIDTTNYVGSLPGLNQVGFGAIHDWTDMQLVSFTAGTWGSATPSMRRSIKNNIPRLSISDKTWVVSTQLYI